MPHSKQAKKRLRQSFVRKARNQTVKSAYRTYIKRFTTALEEGDLEKARQELPQTMKQIDKAAKKGVIHWNQASRKISRLHARLNKLEKETTT